jgi:hypothetical protein
MRRILAGFGAFVLILIVLGAAGFGYLVWRGARLDREAASYSVDADRAITSHWNASELTARATPQLAGSVTADKLASLFAWLGTLGPLLDQPNCRGSSAVLANLGSASATLGRYACTARYRAGEATVRLALVKANGVWRINGFNVTSPALLPATPPLKT